MTTSNIELAKGYAQLDNLWQRGREFLGSRYAIMGGAMSWISEKNLVSAISRAGGFGVLACGSLKPEELKVEIAKTFELAEGKPFGVNAITLRPDVDDLIDACGEMKVSHIVLAGGLPTASSIKRAKDTGAKVICFAPALVLAKKLARAGADALVIEGSEAGGHIGPVSTSVLVQEILPFVKDVPIFVAGGIGRGEAIASFLEMGAAGCQLGTKFVCANECIAHEKFKKAFLKASARDAMPTVQVDPAFPVIPVRAILNEGTKEFMTFQQEMIHKAKSGEISAKDAQLKIEYFWAGALRRAVIDGDVERGSLMAGQSVGMVTKEQPVAEIMEELVQEAAQTLEERNCKRALSF
ncbi:MAG: NAD(P)H-dependent flavin oxidoreductase [Alphaproteobacteria bacterium]